MPPKNIPAQIDKVSVKSFVMTFANFFVTVSR